ncbi:hypothetical protein EJB05_52438, partial [Eragrostis curvula]
MAAATAAAAALCKIDVPPVANYGVLPPDMLYDIMLLLSADVLCRLRLVCKQWRSLTSDSLFIKAHASRHPLLVATGNRTNEIHVVDFAGNIVRKIRPSQLTGNLQRLFDSLGSRDHKTQLDLFCVEAPHSFAVLNLATGTVAANVLIERWGQKYPYVPTSFVGYVSSTREYKVLLIYHQNFSQYGRCHAQACEVIALGGREKGARTRRLMCNGSVVVDTRSRHAAVVRGVAYFLVDLIASANVRPDSIACFDFTTEAWRPELLPGPLSIRNLAIDEATVHNGTRAFRLAALGGYLVTVDYNLLNRSTDLWFLENLDTSLWTKRYSIRDPPPWDLCLFYLNGVSFPLEVLDDGRIIVWAEYGQVLRAYDPQKGTWDDFSMMKDYNAMGMLQGSLLCSVREVICN